MAMKYCDGDHQVMILVGSKKQARRKLCLCGAYGVRGIHGVLCLCGASGVCGIHGVHGVCGTQARQIKRSERFWGKEVKAKINAYASMVSIYCQWNW